MDIFYNMKIVLLLITVFQLVITSQAYKCPGTSSVPPNAPSMPTINQSFQAKVEVNIVEKNYTTFVEEHLDYEGNRGLVIFHQNGKESRAIYNYDAIERYNIKDGQCTTVSLNASSETDLFGYDTSDGIFHINTAADAFRFGTKYGQYFIGKSTIRGKPVNQWQTCFNWTTTNSTFSADYYFSDPSWNSSSGLDVVPVRIEVKGQQTFSDGSPPLVFHNVYDFLDFMSTTSQDPVLFETPPEIFCPRRVNSRPFPKFPTHFSYRETVVTSELVSNVDIWYNYDKQILRMDYKGISYPASTSPEPLSVIHDFTAGVSYLTNRHLGNCTVMPIENGTFDSIFKQSSVNNGSYVQMMKRPLALVLANSSQTYVGKRTVDNGIVCDVWISERSDIDLTGIGIPSNTTIESFFLVKDFDYLPELGSVFQLPDGFQIPYRTIINSFGLGIKGVYDYSNFNPSEPPLTVFDTTSCFSDDKKLRIMVQLKGKYSSDTEYSLKYNAQLVISQTMGLSPLRFQEISLEYDNSFVYISGTVLDRPPSAAQFTLISGKEIETADDLVLSNITDSTACADYCVLTTDFLCNSFDFCAADTNSCRLSKRHAHDGPPVFKKSICNHYSRTVNSSAIDTKTIKSAYGDLRLQVFSGGLEIAVTKNTGQVIDFIGIDTQIQFGRTDDIKMPSLPNSFSYNAELVVPSLRVSYEVDVYYDYGYKLARYDYRAPPGTAPYYTPFTISSIHDFNTGIAYDINQVYLNCTVTAINPRGPLGFDSELTHTAGYRSGQYVIQMKSPLEFTDETANYTFAGQKTVRGILCNVFEAVVNNFVQLGTNKTTRANYQYYFQSSSWTTLSDGSTDSSDSQPIRLNIYTEESGLFLRYNFFSFKDEHIPLSKFDIKPCYSDGLQHRFMMVFNQPYHPYLELAEDIFKSQAVTTLSTDIGVSTIRFQEPEVDYSFSSVFLTVTLLDVIDSIYHFKQIAGTLQVEHSEIEIQQITGPADCADSCMTSLNIFCNGFDFCLQTSMCLLHSDHISTITNERTQDGCSHYSRLVNSTGPSVSMRHAYDVLKDITYKHLFKITIPQPAGGPFVYTATNIRDDINKQYSPTNTEGVYLQQFTVVKKNMVLSKHDATIPQTAVDDCATICATIDKFDCQSFEYCYTTGDCSLSHLHPDQHPELLKQSSFCDMFARHYLAEYQLYKGQVLSTQADKIVSMVTTSENCAADCSKDKSFACLSFDFCAKDMSCRLRKSHVLDAGSTITTSTTCDHYSRNYIYDFQNKGGRLVQDTNDVIVNSATPASCAKLCVDQSGIMCNSFEYCGNTTQCRLSSGVSIGFKVEKDYCDVYTRARHSKTNTNSTSKTKTVCSVSETGSSTGAMVGLAFGMLLPGIILGALGLFMFQKRRRNSEPMNIHFVRHDEGLNVD